LTNVSCIGAFDNTQEVMFYSSFVCLCVVCWQLYVKNYWLDICENLLEMYLGYMNKEELSILEAIRIWIHI